MFVSKLSAFTKSIGARKFLIWVALVCTAPLFCLLTDLWQHPSFISGGLAMRIMAASLIAKGELPYFDFWDWTQPIVFELLKYPYLLSSALESLRLPLVPVYSIFIPQCIFCMIVASLILATSVCVQALHSQVKTPATGGTDGLPTEDLEYQDQRAQDFAVPCLLGFVLTMLIARYDFGELQYLLLLTLVPWLLLRWFAHQGLRVRAKLAAFTGVVAGVGACFDVPFVAIFIILELILTLRSGRWRALLSIEWLAFLLTIGINLLVLTHMDEAVSKAFWQWTMPLKLLNYSLVDPTIYAPLSCPKRVDVLYGMVAAGIIAFLLGRKHSFFAPLMALMLVGLGLYMLEGQGFSHDLILTIFASTTTFACALSMASKKLVHWLGEKASRIKPDQQYRFIVLTLVVLATCLTWMSLEHDRTKLLTYYYSRSITGDYQAEDLLEQSTRLQAPVTIFCNNIEPVYPYFLFSGRRPGGYLLWARPLKLFEWLKNNSGLKGPMKDFYDYTYWNIHNEIDQHKTEAFILSDYGVLDTFGREQMFKQLDRDYRIDVKTGHFFSCGNHQPREFSGYNGPFLFFVNKKGAGQ